MLAVVATFVAALAAELIARRLEAPIGAIGPSVALYVVICALGSGRWAPTTARVRARRRRVPRRACNTPRWRPGARGSRARANRRSQLVDGRRASRVRSSSRSRSRSDRACPARAAARGSTTGRSGAGSGSSILNVTSPLVSVGAKLTGRQSTDEVFTVATTEPKGNYWRVDRARPVPERRLGPELRPAPGVATSRARPHGPGTTLVTADVPARQHRRALAARPRTARSSIRRRQVAGAPGSTSLFLDNPLAGLTYAVQSEIANPPKSILESVTTDDLTRDGGRRRAAGQLLDPGPRLRGATSPRQCADAVRQGDRADERLPAARRSCTTPTVTLGDRRRRARQVLVPHPPRLLRAVRGGVRRARPLDRAADTGRGRLPARHAGPTACGTSRRRTRTPGPRSGSVRRSAGSASSRRRAASTR